MINYQFLFINSLLSISDLHISVEKTEVVHGIDLHINEGEIHAIMGPNGSGKSTLVNALMGHPKYEMTKGSVRFRGKNLFTMQPHERAQAGLFLAFQYPKEISGVSLRHFLFAAHTTIMQARGERKSSVLTFQKLLEQKMRLLHMDPALAERSVNQGFSGGEKKKAEILQLTILQPHLALLDETDSGLDVDALKIVADGIHSIRGKRETFSALLVTHYTRLLHYIIPDFVHVMIGGKIVESGEKEAAERLEEEGYEKLRPCK